MADNLRITSHVDSNENINRVPPKKAPQQMIDVVDPTKVSSRNDVEQNKNESNASQFTFNRNSVFNKFLQQLAETMPLSQNLGKVLFSAFLRNGETVDNTNKLDILLAELMSQFKMEKTDIVENLKFMEANATKFSGKMFEVLRYLQKNTTDSEFEQLLGKFLKSYDTYLSTGETTKAIEQNLKSILMYMPKLYREKLSGIVDKMIFSDPKTNTNMLSANIPQNINTNNAKSKVLNQITQNNISQMQEPSGDTVEKIGPKLTNFGYDENDSDMEDSFETFTTVKQNGNERDIKSDTARKDIRNGVIKQNDSNVDEVEDTPEALIKNFNLNILKEKIVPFLSEYVSKTNDFGKSRDIITLLVHNIARLNLGSKQSVVSDFENLIDYCKYNMNLPEKNVEVLKEILIDNISAPKIHSNKLVDSLVEVVKEGLKETNSIYSRSIYKDISNALLLDTSTFMPLTHIFLPINYNGMFMFSEIWIDKNYVDESDSEKNKSSSNSKEKSMKLYLTFEIKNLGNFEAIILYSNMKAKVQVNYPSTLEGKDREIRENIAKIFSNIGITPEQISLTNAAPQKNIESVFENLYERKRSINVTI